MTKQPKPKDRRKELYTSVRISKRAYKVLSDRANKERRSIVAALDLILGV